MGLGAQCVFGAVCQNKLMEIQMENNIIKAPYIMWASRTPTGQLLIWAQFQDANNWRQNYWLS